MAVRNLCGRSSGSQWSVTNGTLVSSLAGKAYSFAGDGHLAFDQSVIGGYPFTVVAFFRTTNSTAAARCIFSASNSTDSGDKLGLRLTSSHFAQAFVGSNVVTGSTALNDGQLHSVAIVANAAGTVSLYVDGASVGTPTSGGTFLTLDRTTLAAIRSGTTTESWTGEIGFPVLVYSRALDAIELQARLLNPHAWARGPTAEMLFVPDPEPAVLRPIHLGGYRGQTVNTLHPQVRGIQAWLPLNHQLDAVSGGSLVGRIQGTNTATTFESGGRVGGRLVFDGSTSFITYPGGDPQLTFAGGQPITIFARCLPGTLDRRNIVVFKDSEFSQANYWMALGVTGDGFRLEFGYRDAANPHQLWSNEPVVTHNEEASYAVTGIMGVADSWRMFKDGKEIEGGVTWQWGTGAEAPVTGAGPLYVGQQNSASRFTGRICDVRILRTLADEAMIWEMDRHPWDAIMRPNLFALPPSVSTAEAQLTFGGLSATGSGAFSETDVFVGRGPFVFSGISTYHYLLLDSGTDRLLLQATSSDVLLLEAVVESTAVAGLHYPNSTTTYDIANLNPFYASFNRYDWVNPQDGRYDDSTYAHVTLNSAQAGYTYILELSNLAFEIPQFSRIRGIQVQIERRKTGTSVSDDWSISDTVVQLCKETGSVVGTNRAVSTEYPLTHTYATYGGASDLWGATWTPAEINATGFGVAFAAIFVNQSADFNGTVEVDAVRVTVFFEPAATGSAACVFGGLFTISSGFTLPKRTGVAGVTFAGLDTTAAGTFVEPVYSASAASTFGGVETIAEASFSDVIMLASAAMTFGGIETAAAGVTHDLYSAAATQTFAGFDTTATGLVLRPVFAGSAATIFGGLETTAAATFTAPVYTGQMAVTFGSMQLSATATALPPQFDGQATQVTGSLELSAAGTTEVPVYTGDSAVDVPAFAMAASAQFIEQQFVNGIAAMVMPPLDMTAAGLQIDPVYSGEGAFAFTGLQTLARAIPLRGIHFHAGTLSDDGGDPMSLGAVIETDYTFIEGYRETAKIEFVNRLGADRFTGTPAVTEIGKPSVTISDPRLNASLENIDSIIAPPNTAVMFDVEVTAAKKQPTVLRIDCDTNNALRSFVVDFVFHTRK